MSATVAASAALDNQRVPPALAGGMLILAGFVLAMANFMANLDVNIANVAMPHIAGSLGASVSEGTSVITFYAVAEAISIPLTAWLANRFGTVRVFFIAVAGFGVTSALCGLAPSLQMLVLFRLLQGFSAGPMMPLAQTLLMQIVPKSHQTIAFGLFAMTIIVAPILGPLVGGVIADTIGWEWAFFINVPIAIFLLAVGYPLLRPQETEIRKAKIDTVGLVLLVLWVGALQLMLDMGKEHEWFESPLVVGLLVVAVVGFIAFLIWELTAKDPVVDLSVFRHRSFAIATLIVSITFAIFIGSSVLLPLWLQTNMGYSATSAGQLMAFNGILGVLAAPIAAKLMGKVDARAIACAGLLGLAWTLIVRIGFTTDVTFGQMIPLQLIQGGVIPLFVIPLMTVSLVGIDQKQMASASSVMTFTRTIAGAVASSIVISLWQNSSRAMRVETVGAMEHTDAVMGALTSSGASQAQAAGLIEGLLQQQSVMLATNQIFALCIPAVLLAAAMVWLTPKPPRGATMPAGH